MPHEPIDPSLLKSAVDAMQGMLNAKRARHYRAIFLDEDGSVSIHGQKVLAHLNRFCRGNASAFHADPRIHALLEGRREVLLLILGSLKIDSATIAPFLEVIDE